jgi:hypothetical protein
VKADVTITAETARLDSPRLEGGLEAGVSVKTPVGGVGIKGECSASTNGEMGCKGTLEGEHDRLKGGVGTDELSSDAGPLGLTVHEFHPINALVAIFAGAIDDILAMTGEPGGYQSTSVAF